MKLIKQTTLYYHEGASDKVYQVDLCEVDAELHVVNFRYGRRGGTLKEGAKTVSPVSKAEAEKIFDDLVSSKVKKGYLESGGTDAPPPKPRSLKQKLTVDHQARERLILERLSAPPQSQKPLGAAIRRIFSGKPADRSGWTLERVIQRAGELKCKSAAPALVKLIGSGGPMRDYCIVWSLGWCGDATNISALGKIYGDPATPDFLRRMACEALLKLSDGSTRTAFRKDMSLKLPASLRNAIDAGAQTFTQALNNYLSNGDATRFVVLDLLYLIEGAAIRPALLDFARTSPLRPPIFRFLRHWFKAAEYRRDAEMFGILAYRFEKEPAMFHSPYKYVGFTDTDGQYAYVEKATELASPNSRIAYGSQTRAYMRRRVWRTLRRLAALADPDYVKMAVGVLLPFTDSDAQPVREREYRSWTTQRARTTSQVRRVSWDAFAGYYSFGHILFGNSPRYELKPRTLAWRCTRNYRTGGIVPNIREESFPKLWDAVPVGLLHLLSESQCLPVHEFATKALRTCQEFCTSLDISAIVMLLGSSYQVTAGFGFELAQLKYTSQSPDAALVEAVALCALADARAQACQWIKTSREVFLKNPLFLEKLLFGNFADVRASIRTLLQSAAFADTEAKIFAARLIANLLALAPDQNDIARDVSESVFSIFATQLKTIGLEIIKDLLGHPLVEIQELAAHILLNHEISPESLPPSLLENVLQSKHESVRAAGARLLNAHSDPALRAKIDLLLSLAHQASNDIRKAIHPTLKRLFNDGAASVFTANFVRRALVILLQPEEREGAHSFLARLLRDDAPDIWTDALSNEDIRALLGSKSKSAQELGGAALFKTPERFTDEPIQTLVALARCEALAVRQAAYALLRARLTRLRANKTELAEAVRILDSPWDDARAAGFAFFRDEFEAIHWNPETLIGVCDGVRTDVQRFGQELITRHFSNENGSEYLLKLSEHPTPTIQFFVTNFLERFAADAPERLRELTPYFLSALSRVNQSRALKARSLNFLKSEAMKSDTAAAVVAEILSRQSGTIALCDKAAAIETLTLIHKRYPNIASPVTVKRVQRRA